MLTTEVLVVGGGMTGLATRARLAPPGFPRMRKMEAFVTSYCSRLQEAAWRRLYFARGNADPPFTPTGGASKTSIFANSSTIASTALTT